MARSDLVKRLFHSFRLGDQPGSLTAAREALAAECALGDAKTQLRGNWLAYQLARFDLHRNLGLTAP